MPMYAFSECIAILRRQLQRPLPGTDAHISMAPRVKPHSQDLKVDDKTCRKAGVLSVLFPMGLETGLLLTKRRETLSQHAGQISFPGGRNEPDESLRETALRETREEVGLLPDYIDVVGELSPLYISVSNFCVYPFIGAVDFAPEDLEPQTSEVQKIIALPLAKLADPANKQVERWTLRDTPVDVPFYRVEEEIIWGATAMMIAELLEVLDG